MPARMTSTAYRQGVKNLLVPAIGVLVLLLPLVGLVSLVTARPCSKSFGIATTLLGGLLLLGFLATWLYERQAAGQVLLDCGFHPSRGLFLLNAVIWLALCPLGLSLVSSAPVESWRFSIVCGVPFTVFWLILAGGRLQVRENGIWQYWGLLRWTKIESYQWANDCTWLVKVKGFSIAKCGALPVSPEDRDAFDQLLQKYCNANHPR